MKIPRHLRQDQDWPFTVSGPGWDDGKLFPSLGAAIAFAQMYAGKIGGSYLVREHGDIVCSAERLANGTVITKGTR